MIYTKDNSLKNQMEDPIFSQTSDNQLLGTLSPGLTTDFTQQETFSQGLPGIDITTNVTNVDQDFTSNLDQQYNFESSAFEQGTTSSYQFENSPLNLGLENQNLNLGLENQNFNLGLENQNFDLGNLESNVQDFGITNLGTTENFTGLGEVTSAFPEISTQVVSQEAPQELYQVSDANADYYQQASSDTSKLLFNSEPINIPSVLPPTSIPETAPVVPFSEPTSNVVSVETNPINPIPDLNFSSPESLNINSTVDNAFSDVNVTNYDNTFTENYPLESSPVDVPLSTPVINTTNYDYTTDVSPITSPIVDIAPTSTYTEPVSAPEVLPELPVVNEPFNFGADVFSQKVVQDFPVSNIQNYTDFTPSEQVVSQTTDYISNNVPVVSSPANDVLLDQNLLSPTVTDTTQILGTTTPAIEIPPSTPIVTTPTTFIPPTTVIPPVTTKIVPPPPPTTVTSVPEVITTTPNVVTVPPTIVSNPTPFVPPVTNVITAPTQILPPKTILPQAVPTLPPVPTATRKTNYIPPVPAFNPPKFLTQRRTLYAPSSPIVAPQMRPPVNMITRNPVGVVPSAVPFPQPSMLAKRPTLPLGVQNPMMPVRPSAPLIPMRPPLPLGVPQAGLVPQVAAVPPVVPQTPLASQIPLGTQLTQAPLIRPQVGAVPQLPLNQVQPLSPLAMNQMGRPFVGVPPVQPIPRRIPPPPSMITRRIPPPPSMITRRIPPPPSMITRRIPPPPSMTPMGVANRYNTAAQLASIRKAYSAQRYPMGLTNARYGLNTMRNRYPYNSRYGYNTMITNNYGAVNPFNNRTYRAAGTRLI